MTLPDPQTVAKRVIEAHGGIDQAIAIAEKHIAEFNSLWLQDAERIGRILRAHLTVEHFLTRYIEFKNPMLAALTETRITFNQKVDLLHPSDRLASELKPGLRRLNQIRNRLAHNLQVEVRGDDVEVFRGVTIFTAMHNELAKRSGEALPEDPIAICEAFAKFAAGMLQAGSAADAKIWANALKPCDEKA
jgi:hypothetical protein